MYLAMRDQYRAGNYYFEHSDFKFRFFLAKVDFRIYGKITYHAPELIFVAVGPLDVHLLGHKEPVSAGRAYEFKCQSVGARPPPEITWWKGSIQLKDNITNRVSDRHKVVTQKLFSFTAKPFADESGWQCDP